MISLWRPEIFKKTGGEDRTGSDHHLRNRAMLKSLLIAGLTIDAVLGLIFVYFFFLLMPYFNLQQIDVTGNRRLSYAEIIEASDLKIGANLLTIDLNKIVVELKRNAWIRSAIVHRRFPGQLILEIEERTPRAILAADKIYYVDDQAEFFARLLPGDSVNYPLFTGVTDQQLKSNSAEVRELLRLGLGLLEIVEYTASDEETFLISEIRLNLEEGLSIKTDSGRLVILGKNGFENKMQRFARLKQFLRAKGEWQNARIIDLDFDDRALVRPDKPRLQG
ncbi:MAG: cell division protein FtsQ/DivIB [Desulfomonilaceae bacterium]